MTRPAHWLRHQLQSTVVHRAWPHHTAFPGVDVVIADVSMLHAADQHGTPCVRNAEADHGMASVIVARIDALIRNPNGTTEIWVDAELHHAEPVAGCTRLLGRRSRARRRWVELRPHGADALLARLPADVEPGDLIAIPCRRPIALANLRRSSRHPERMDR
ncbi:hypothetical protein [Agromyces sp. PvR057]|uniref:hypothetical protein n=1 Tax=Agromyces sp. PvR057 TaxID=3156403 RepID=UPI000E3A9F33